LQVVYDSALAQVTIDWTQALVNAAGFPVAHYDEVHWYAGPDPVYKISDAFTIAPGLLPYKEEHINILPRTFADPKYVENQTVDHVPGSDPNAIFLNVHAVVCDFKPM
jgi:hypothetical protein